ncbi:MAG: hypothetical protein NVSMB51_09450 [Solirubrobacteraceae bacterium]
MIGDLLLMIGAFALASVLALATSASLGHAFTYGQLAFAGALVFVLVRR